MSYEDQKVQGRVADDRGWVTRLRRRLPAGASRLLRSWSLWLFARLPHSLKYRVAGFFQQKRLPYRFVRPGDWVVQVGAPRDILLAGRSRAVHFARRVGSAGRVLVVEPDPSSAETLQEFLARQKLAEWVRVVNRGAWREQGKLEFLIFPSHPAANRVFSADNTDELLPGSESGGERVTIEVDTLARILSENEFRRPRLVSITTNGSERDIVSTLFSAGSEFLPRYVSLGPPNDANVHFMEEHGYAWIAWDDRGQLFEREQGG